MYQAVAASSIPMFPANPFRRMFDMLISDRAPMAPSAGVEIALIQRRLIALRGSAPTWHPLHLERTVKRTVVEPLRAVLPTLRGAAARSVQAALADISAIGDPTNAFAALDRATLSLSDATQGTRHA